MLNSSRLDNVHTTDESEMQPHINFHLRIKSLAGLVAL